MIAKFARTLRPKMASPTNRYRLTAAKAYASTAYSTFSIVAFQFLQTQVIAASSHSRTLFVVGRATISLAHFV